MSQHKTNTYAEIASASTNEPRRLARLGQLLYPSTKQLFAQAGITTGMKVLDVGSGAGDVTLLLAELVGPIGSIVGVEVNAAILETARARVHAAGLTNVSFVAGDIRDVTLDDDFDAVVERNVLIYLSDPAAVLRRCLEHLRPGGVVVFQDLDVSLGELVTQRDAMPPLARQVASWVYGGLRQAGVELQIGCKFPDLFLEAGLPYPTMALDSTVAAGPDWTGYAYLVDLLVDLLPKLYDYGILKEAMDAERYVEQMRAEVLQQHSFVPLALWAGAWARKES